MAAPLSPDVRPAAPDLQRALSAAEAQWERVILLRARAQLVRRRPEGMALAIARIDRYLDGSAHREQAPAPAGGVDRLIARIAEGARPSPTVEALADVDTTPSQPAPADADADAAGHRRSQPETLSSTSSSISRGMRPAREVVRGPRLAATRRALTFAAEVEGSQASMAGRPARSATRDMRRSKDAAPRKR